MALFSFFQKDKPPTGPEGGPLTAEHHALIGEARLRANAVLRAAHVAHRQMIGLVLMGVPTIMLAFFGGFSLTGLVMGLWMTVAGVLEGMGEARIRRLHPQVLKTLCINQLALGAMFVVISAWWMLQVKLGWDDKQLGQTSAGISQLVGGAGTASSPMLTSTFHLVAYAAYGSVFVGGLLECGLTALYYRYRARQLEKYLAETPDWIVAMHHSGAL